MKILIIEDEEPAALRLKKLVEEILPGVEILDMLVSVRSSIEWINNHPAPNLILYLPVASPASWTSVSRNGTQARSR